MLNGRDNTRRLFANEPGTRVGLRDVLWPDTLTKWVAQGYPTQRVKRTKVEKKIVDGREVEQTVETEQDVPEDVTLHFGMDMNTAGGGFDQWPIKGYSEIVQETAEWKVVRNGAGASLKYWKNKSGTPEHVDFRMTTREIWERDYRRHLLTPDPTRVNIPSTKETLERRHAQGLWVYYGHTFIFENLRQSLGDVCFYESVLLDPDWIHDFNRVYTDFYKAHFKMLFEGAGVPDAIFLFEDMGYNKGLFLSPRVMEKLFFPYYTEMVEFFHSYGLKVMLHTCGSEREALPMIVQAGFDALNPMEIAAGNDPFEYAEKYADKFVFIGGFDKRIIETHDHDLLRRELTKYVRGMKERGARLILGSDHSISTNVDLADFDYFIKVYRELAEE